ncbi:hypothetical protein RIF29_26990 [Crotalaria pallida]|uniref:Uncharacterized protein n=1 Tax=Crotalaria pallida TaxID=3830 RepID=A0AAN9ENA6_CROPI
MGVRVRVRVLSGGGDVWQKQDEGFHVLLSPSQVFSTLCYGRMEFVVGEKHPDLNFKFLRFHFILIIWDCLSTSRPQPLLPLVNVGFPQQLQGSLQQPLSISINECGIASETSSESSTTSNSIDEFGSASMPSIDSSKDWFISIVSTRDAIVFVFKGKAIRMKMVVE